MRTWSRHAVLAVGIVAVFLCTTLVPGTHPWVGESGRASPGLRASVALPAFNGVLTINPDGSLSSPNAPVTISGNTYTWTATMNGSIVDKRNASVLNGNGHNLNYTTGPAAITLADVHQVTVQNFRITNSTLGGIFVAAGSQVSVLGNRISGPGHAIGSLGTTDLNVSSNLAPSTAGIAVYQDTGVVMLQNNVSFSTTYGFDIENTVGVTLGNNSATFVALEAVRLVADSTVRLWGNSVWHATGDALYLWQVNRASLLQNLGAHAGSDGVYAGSSAFLTLANNDFSHATFEGLYFDTVQSVTVDHNLLAYGTYEGLYFYHATSFSVTNNDLTRGGYEGFYADYASNGVVQGNNASFFRYEGFGLDDSSNVTFSNNTASYDQYSSGEGFYLYADTRCTVHSNTALHAGYGLYAEESFQLTVSNNVFSHANGSGYGIYLYGNSESSLLNNDVSYAGQYGLEGDYNSALVVSNLDARSAGYAGVYMSGGTTNTLLGVRATQAAAYGAYFYGLNGLTLANSQAGSGPSGAEGFYLYQGTGATLTNDSSWGGLVGLDLQGVLNAAVMGSNLSGSNTGLLLSQTSQTTIQGNTLWNDNYSFSSQNSSASVVLYQNNFLNDRGYRLGSPTPGVEPQFDHGYPLGGNFWSNHTGPDAQSGPGQNLSGSDGIVDTPVQLDRTSADHYPLAHAWAGHSVTFVAVNLPPGTRWGVTFNGVASTTTARTLAFNESNAATSAYSYSVAPVPGYVASPWSGSGTYQQADLGLTVSFSAFNYTVTVHGTALPSSAPWAVVVGGVTHSGSGPTLTFNEANGTYAYSVHGPAGFLAQPADGTLTVSGSTVSLTVNFTAIPFSVTFAETGLAGGTSWSVTLAGQTKSSTTPTITFSKPNGTYTYSIGGIGGTAAHPANGQVVVQGGAVTLPVAFGPAANAAGTGIYSAASVDGLIALVVVLAIIAVLGIALAVRARRKPLPAGPVAAYAGAGNAPTPSASPPTPEPVGPSPGGGPPPAWSEDKSP